MGNYWVDDAESGTTWTEYVVFMWPLRFSQGSFPLVVSDEQNDRCPEQDTRKTHRKKITLT